MAEERKRLGLISWMVLVLVAVIGPTFGAAFTQFEFLKDTLLFIVSGVVLGGWGVSVLAERKISLTGGRIATVLVVLGLFAVLAAAWAPSEALGLVGSAQWLALATLFLVVIAPVGRPIRFLHFAVAVAVGTAASGLLGVLDLAGVGLTSSIWDAPGAPASFDARELAVGYYAVALPVCSAGLFRATDLGRRVLCGVAVLLGAVHFGVCADPWVVGIVGGVAALTTLAFGAFQGFDRLSLTIGPIGALAAALLLAAGLSFGGPTPGPANEATSLPWIPELEQPQPKGGAEIRDPRFSIQRIEEAPNWQARSYMIGIAFDLFRDEPIIGHGPGGWWGTQSKYPRPDEPFVAAISDHYPAFRSPHNGFALTMAELGGVGLFLLFAWLSALIGITVTALAQRSEPQNWLVEHFGLVAGVAGGFALAVFTPLLELAAPSVLLFVAAALLVRESAALNDFKGMSAVWSINSTGRRWDTSLFCGLVPLVLGVLLCGVGVFWGVTSYYRSWGDLAMLRTQHELAIDKYELAHDILGGDGDMLYNYALAHKRLGRLAEARDEINEAAQLREYDVRIITLVSTLHLQDRKYADAVKAARRAVSLFPNYFEGRRHLAAALNLQGRMTDAASELQELLKLDPPDAVLGQVHRELGEHYEGPLKNPAKAIEHYKLALGLLKQDFVRARVKAAVEELEKEIERQRLKREGKPIPPELAPKGAPDGHGPGDGHQH